MSSHREEFAEVPGKLITPAAILFFGLVCVGFALIAYRFLFGIGAVTNLSDGYPWGIWIAYDVSVGTAFACGGYALAITCYILNGWKYHHLMRGAIVMSMFGYALAGFSVVVDLGRYWNMYGFFMPSRWQPNSAMFEVALCVMAYTTVLVIEFLPMLFEKLGVLEKNNPKYASLSRTARAIGMKLDKVLIFIIALGITLPTMHQSSLGSLFIITGSQLHPLWQSLALPLLFLMNAVLMGFSIVIFEDSLTSVKLNRPFESIILNVAKIAAYVGIAWLVVRFVDLVVRGQIGAMFSSGFHSIMFWIEIILIVTSIVIFFVKKNSPRSIFYASLMLCIGGGLYRFNTYLFGFNPGNDWFAYFPSVSEFFITLGIIAIEILGYLLLIKLLRVLPKHEPKKAVK